MSTDHHDVIIVGAGSAGCALAARLSEDPSRRVLVLEAGRHYGRIDQYPEPLQTSNLSFYSLPGNPNSWPFIGRLTDNISYPLTRGKVVGGSSAVNGCIFTRGHPDDYDAWAAAGNDEWSFAKVLPFFIRQEADLDFGKTSIHGADGPIPVKRAAKDDLSPVSDTFVEAVLGHGFEWDPDLNAPETGGVGCLPTNSVDGIRRNVAVGYLEPILGRTNLALRERVFVRRVLFDGIRAIGVEASEDGEPRTFFGDEIVLCAGGLKSPQLLMLSGVGPSAMLRRLGIPVIHDSPYVGKGLMDDPAVGVPFEISAHAHTGPGRTIAEVALNFAEERCGSEDMQLMVMNYNKFAMLFGGIGGNSLTRPLRAASFMTRRPLRTYSGLKGASLGALRNDYRNRGDLTIRCGISVEQSRGELRLVSADPDDAPDIDLNYLSEPGDRHRFRVAVRLACELLQKTEFRRIGAARRRLADDVLREDAALDRWIATHLYTSSHSSCTARMGPESDESAVVDQYCRVYGVDNLRVVDLSVLPVIPRRAPNATAVMLGERVAEFYDRSI